jgi:2-isopropylmalate synthase
MGFSLSDDETNKAFLRFKDLADKKKEISNLDIESIVNDEAQDTSQDRFKLSTVQVSPKP